MRLPPGVPDRYFLHQLALELGMPVAEMCERMSAHELGVEWPAFFAARNRLEKWQDRKTELETPRSRGRRR